MDIYQFRTLVELFKNELGELSKTSYQKDIFSHAVEFAKLQNIVELIPNFLPELIFFRNNIKSLIYGFKFDDAISTCKYILEVLDLMNQTNKHINEGKVFLSVEDKLKEAGIAFRTEDYPSVLNCLNTAIELLLKDKLDIPTTITKINTAKIIEICIKENVGISIKHLNEINKHVCNIDNKIKHQSYMPSKLDSINAIKSVEDLKKLLEHTPINMTNELKEKIYSGV